MSQVLAAVFHWFRSALIENAGLKAVSLVFAIGLFVYLHRAEEQFDRTFPVGVFSQKPPDEANRELMTPLPPNVYVTLRGSTRALEQLMRDDPPLVEIDLRDGQAQVVSFDAAMLDLPQGVEVLMFDPPSIPLEWQDVVSRMIPVQASLTGTPAEGYVVSGQPLVSRHEVSVRGPKRLVEVMQFARLAAFDVTGLTEGEYQRPIAIDAPPPRVSYVGPTNVTVSVKITRRVSEVKFERLAVEVVGVLNGITNPRHVVVTVVGPPEIVRGLTAEQVVPRVDLRAVADEQAKQPHGTIVAPVTVDVANAEASVQPPTVTVKW